MPYDTPGAVRRFLARIRPRVAIIMETELWPNLLRSCGERGVPVVFASARLAARSVPRYRRSAPLFSAAVGNAWVAAQSEADAERFIAIGADRGRTRVVGNLKFDMQLGEAVIEKGRELRRLVLGSRPVWIAGSTQRGGGSPGARGACRAPARRCRGRRPASRAGTAPSAALRERREPARAARRAFSTGAAASRRCVPKRRSCWSIRMGELTAFYAACGRRIRGRKSRAGGRP